MRPAFKIMLVLFMLPLFGAAQEEEEPKSRMVAIHYMKPLKGKEPMLKKAVEEHNRKYHAEDPYKAGLNTIVTGEDAGWMVWVMGPFSYTDLDNAPGEGEHMDNWRQKVDPYVEKYGRVEHWRYNKKMSNSTGDDYKMQVLWLVDVEKGEYYRFREFMTKIQKVMAKNEESLGVWNAEFSQQDGREVAMVFPFEKWGDRDVEDFNMKSEYEAMYGEGSWQSAMDEWEDFITSIKAEVWRELL